MSITDRLYVDQDDLDIIEKIKSYNDLYNFEEAQRKERFLLAMAVGEAAGGDSYPIQRKNDGSYVLDKYLSLDDYALIYSIAINKFKSAEVVCEKEKIYEYAQNCAHLGFKLLLEEVTNTSHGSVEKRMLTKLDEMYEKLEL